MISSLKCKCKVEVRNSLEAEQVKDLVSLLWLWLQLWYGFNSWPETSACCRWTKKKQNKKKKGVKFNQAEPYVKNEFIRIISTIAKMEKEYLVTILHVHPCGFCRYSGCGCLQEWAVLFAPKREGFPSFPIICGTLCGTPAEERPVEPGCSNLLSFPKFYHCQQGESESLQIYLDC